MKISEEFCSGSCNGKRQNCPWPQACGWPDESESNSSAVVIAVVVCAAFFVGVIVWL